MFFWFMSVLLVENLKCLTYTLDLEWLVLTKINAIFGQLDNNFFTRRRIIVFDYDQIIEYLVVTTTTRRHVSIFPKSTYPWNRFHGKNTYLYWHKNHFFLIIFVNNYFLRSSLLNCLFFCGIFIQQGQLSYIIIPSFCLGK